MELSPINASCQKPSPLSVLAADRCILGLLRSCPF
jgi:hypothetical protein